MFLSHKTPQAHKLAASAKSGMKNFRAAKFILQDAGDEQSQSIGLDTPACGDASEHALLILRSIVLS